MNSNSARCVVALSILAGALVTRAQSPVTISDLGTLGGSGSYAKGVNNIGQVVGGSLTAGDAATHAFT